MVSVRLILAADLVATIAQAGVDPTIEGRLLQDAILSDIADRRGSLSWDDDPRWDQGDASGVRKAHQGSAPSSVDPSATSANPTRW